MRSRGLAPAFRGPLHGGCQIGRRLNGTLRERFKVMRSFDNPESAARMLAGLQTYYNYVREHSALGTTPAIEADIDLNLGENRWAGMVGLVANQRQFGGA